MQPSIFEPSQHQLQDIPTYKSSNSSFVAALLAADLAQYISVSYCNGRVFYHVTDHGQCAELERQYMRGVFTRVNPYLLFEARSYLQSEGLRVRQAKVGGRNEQTL